MPKCDLNKVANNIIEITIRHGCSPVNLLLIFRIPFYKNTSGGLILVCFMFKKECSKLEVSETTDWQ